MSEESPQRGVKYLGQSKMVWTKLVKTFICLDEEDDTTRLDTDSRERWTYMAQEDNCGRREVRKAMGMTTTSTKREERVESDD